ncbi:hypothetical protein [Actinomadura opuntiae]|uniref:hypothetical protein n=1 Tax=Actinomadura sp. OS1-43 TaxID=604315 RepID=UPI00255ADDA2|nr:hypothetical protein [Actinomadura sp. OS1-43]MDL4816555.1 hypothetical protein [Actinomadura sp. OS1-43]
MVAMLLRCLVAALIGATVVACGTDRTPPSGYARDLTPAEKASVEDAKSVLIRDCMNRRGFPYWIRPYATAPKGWNFPYVVDDVAWAHRHGYGSDIQRLLDERRRNDPNQRYLASLPATRKAAALTAINGRQSVGLSARLPSGGLVRRSRLGCRAEADRRLYGDLGTWFQFDTTETDLAAMRRVEVQRDSEFKAALLHWAACMRSSGSPYATPMQAHNAAQLAPSNEIHLAVTEATCADRTDFAATAHRLDLRYRDVLRQQHHTVEALGSRMQLRAATHARSILSHHQMIGES